MAVEEEDDEEESGVEEEVMWVDETVDDDLMEDVDLTMEMELADCKREVFDKEEVRDLVYVLSEMWTGEEEEEEEGVEVDILGSVDDDLDVFGGEKDEDVPLDVCLVEDAKALVEDDDDEDDGGDDDSDANDVKNEYDITGSFLDWGGISKNRLGGFPTGKESVILGVRMAEIKGTAIISLAKGLRVVS
jgi:hypothetical protein